MRVCRDVDCIYLDCRELKGVPHSPTNLIMNSYIEIDRKKDKEDVPIIRKSRFLKIVNSSEDDDQSHRRELN